MTNEENDGNLTLQSNNLRSAAASRATVFEQLGRRPKQAVRLDLLLAENRFDSLERLEELSPLLRHGTEDEKSEPRDAFLGISEPRALDYAFESI